MLLYRHRDAIACTASLSLLLALLVGDGRDPQGRRLQAADSLRVTLLTEAEPPPATPTAPVETVSQPAIPDSPSPTASAQTAPAITRVAAEPIPAADGLQLQDAYQSQVRQRLDAQKHWPDDAAYRSLRPAGRVEYFVVVARDGTVVDFGITRVPDIDGAALLAAAVRQTLAQARFEPVPDTAWQGEPDHRFEGALNYAAPLN